MREMNDAELDAVSGGLSCSGAITVAQTYLAMSQIASSEGMYDVANTFTNIAEGVLLGGCGPSK